jgi:hypothetical protein
VAGIAKRHENRFVPELLGRHRLVVGELSPTPLVIVQIVDAHDNPDPDTRVERNLPDISIGSGALSHIRHAAGLSRDRLIVSRAYPGPLER